MNKPRLAVFALLVALVGVTACATMADVVKTKDEGTSKVYRVSSAQAWKITKTVFRWEGSDAIEEHRPRGYMVSRRGKEWAPWTALTVAWVERIDRKHTKVTVVTKRRIGMDVGTTSSETRFHKRFAQCVKIVKAGKFLPPIPPEEL